MSLDTLSAGEQHFTEKQLQLQTDQITRPPGPGQAVNWSIGSFKLLKLILQECSSCVGAACTVAADETTQKLNQLQT